MLRNFLKFLIPRKEYRDPAACNGWDVPSSAED